MFLKLLPFFLYNFYRPDEGTVHAFDVENLQSLFDALKSWEDVFNSEVERFSGDTLLSCEDDLLCLTNCVDSWAESARKVTNLHA